MSEHDSEHSSFIKTPKQLLAVVVLAFVVPIGVISVLASLASRAVDPSATAFSEEAIAKRLKPVGEVVVAAGDGTAAAVRNGQQVFDAVCAACHATGALNAPKVGDTAAWASLIKQGHDHLTETAIKGIRQMPPKGGNPELTDIEVARAVAYMANQSGAKFTEPAPPAGAAPTTATPTSPANPATVASAAAAPANVPPAAAAPAAGGGDAAKGKAVYDASCVACHGAGVAGAPKLGDKAAWAARLKQGVPALYEAALKGKGAMPPKGGNMALSEGDVKAAVDFLVTQAK
jgi:cytochrome c5